MGYSARQTFLSGQPPLIVFTICLTAFGCTMIILAYVIGEKEVPNPDVQMDWNKFFDRIANLNLCPFSTNFKPSNKSTILHPKVPTNSSASHVVDESKSMSAVLSDVVNSAMNDKWQEIVFVDVSVIAKMELHGNFPPKTEFHRKGTVKGKLLGLQGKYSNLLFNMSLSFHPFRNNSCSSDDCPFFQVCISVSLPSDVIPKTKMPDYCNPNNFPSKGRETIIFSEEARLDPNDLSNMCIGLHYAFDARLTEMLTPQDRSIVNLHLMHTSYFMFVMVMTLVCVSLVRGRMRQPKNYLPLQKVPSVT